MTLVIALIFAIRDMADIDSFLDWLHGNLVKVITINPTWSNQSILNAIRGNFTPDNLSVVFQTERNVPPLPQELAPPFIPDFIVYWGYIGSAVYVLKVVTIKMYSKEGFNRKYIPYHIGGLFVGTAVAIVTFFVLVTGGFFGLTIDFNKMSNPAYIQYAYAVVAFFSGYSTRHFVSIMSGIVANVFQHDKRDKEAIEHEAKSQE